MSPHTFRVLATQLSNFIFDGGRADLTKSLSVSPLLQATHSLALGSQTAPPSYNFGAIFGCYKVRNITFPANAIQTFSQVFLQSGLDQDGNVSGRFKYRWTPSTATKLEARVRFTQRALGCTHITPRSCHKAATI